MMFINLPTGTVLQTRRMLLRYPDLDDAAPIYAVIQSPHFPEQLPLKEMSSEIEVEDWLKKLQEGWTAGQVFSWIAVERDSGRMLGQMTLSRIEGDRRWALAFWTHPDEWGKGYASEGAERLLAFAFEVIGAGKIWAGAGEWNVASCRVLEKIGMQYVGVNPQGYYSRGEPIATREYEITRDDWQKRTMK